MSTLAEWVEGQIDLGFAGLETPRFAVYPLADHFAEKLHAYTKLRETPTRVKDLLDLALMLELGLQPSPVLRQTIEAVFVSYATHVLPETFPRPPSAWERPFRQMAEGVGLEPADSLYWWEQLEVFYRQMR